MLPRVRACRAFVFAAIQSSLTRHLPSIIFRTELNKDPQEVIDHTHGRRATDNLRDLKPELRDTPEPEMQPHVQEFEEKILASADEYTKEVRSRRQSMAEEIVSQDTSVLHLRHLRLQTYQCIHSVSHDATPDGLLKPHRDEAQLLSHPAALHQAAIPQAERVLSLLKLPRDWP